MAHHKNTVILTHRDVDGVCAAAIAKVSYPKAEIEFANPPDFVSILNSLSRYDCVIILDLGIDGIQKDEAIAAFRKLSTTSSIIYIDHHIRPPGLTKSSLACKGAHRTDASTSELAWEFFKPTAIHDFIAVLGAIGDYRERTPQMQELIGRYNERRVYPEALFLEWAIMVAEDSFKRGVVEELVQGKWPYQMSIMGKEADAIVRRQRTLERYVRDKAEKICEHVMLIRNPPFKATGPAATLLTKLDNVDIGIASRMDENHVYLSLRRHEESDINLASLIDQSVSKFGGMGGGHAAAAGGKILVERFDELLLEIRRMLPKGRLKRIKELEVKSVDKKTIERKLFREITERKRAEEVLKKYSESLEQRTKEVQESEEKYRIQFEEALDAIFVADAETGIIIDCNRAGSRLVGRKKSEIIGQHQKILHPPEEIEGEFSRTYRLHIKEKAGQVLETQVITKRSEIRDVAIKANLFEFRGRKMLQGIFRDITERKKAENRIKMEREVYRSIARAANRSRSVEELCELALKGIQTAIKYDMADMMVYRESENALFSAAQVGYPEDLYRRTIKRQDLKENSRVAAQAVRERKSIYIDDMKTNNLTSYAHDLVTKYDISTLYMMPLFSRGKLQGVLEVLTTGGRKLSEEDREVLDTISEELAEGIAKAKIEEQLVTVKEAFGWLAVPAGRAPPMDPHP